VLRFSKIDLHLVQYLFSAGLLYESYILECVAMLSMVVARHCIADAKIFYSKGAEDRK